MSWFNTATSAASVLSFASSGYLLDTIGSQALYLLAAALPVLATGVFEAPYNLALLKQVLPHKSTVNSLESGTKIDDNVCTATC